MQTHHFSTNASLNIGTLRDSDIKTTLFSHQYIYNLSQSMIQVLTPHFNPENLHQGIFKAYDIRGIVDSEINAHTATQIGLALASELITHKQRRVAIGYDGRSSNEMLFEAMAQGFLAAGIDVINLGLVTTPMTYFAAFHPSLELNSCIMITGSHNPPEYNGFKMVVNGKTIYKEQIQALKARILAQDFIALRRDGNASAQIIPYDIHQAYQTQVKARATQTAQLKIAVDCGNGVTGAHNIDILKNLGHTVLPLFQEVDGSFPNHHPDPAQPENLKDLIQVVREEKCDLGLAFDGDGDRLGVVTQDGQIIYADRQIMLFMQDILMRHPKQPILFDVKCSSYLAPMIEKAGGIPVMCQTGHSLVKAQMKTLGSPFAGEMSGHIFFADQWFGFDDALYTAARLLAILGEYHQKGLNISQVLNDLPQAYSTPELHLPCENAHQKIEELKQMLQDRPSYLENGTLSTIDGVRVDYSSKDHQGRLRQGFALVRASNTTPILVLRFEGQDQATLDLIQQEWHQYLERVLNAPCV